MNATSEKLLLKKTPRWVEIMFFKILGLYLQSLPNVLARQKRRAKKQSASCCKLSLSFVNFFFFFFFFSWAKFLKSYLSSDLIYLLNYFSGVNIFFYFKSNNGQIKDRYQSLLYRFLFVPIAVEIFNILGLPTVFLLYQIGSKTAGFRNES